MRNALLLIGLLGCLFGVQLLVVDKIVLHDFSAHSATDSEDPGSDGPAGPAVIDLPNSGGYVLLAVGTACLMYFIGSRHQKDKR